MRKIIFIIIAAVGLTMPSQGWAQKYACVNTDYILKSIPEYVNAQKRLDKYVADWTAELAEKNSELDEMRASFEQESYLLPDNLKQRRKEEIKEKEREIRQLQQQRFGAGGDLDKKQAELLKPVQDRVYQMIERVAHDKNYAFVFDKAANSAVLFANKKYDISDDVLELLGVKPGQTNAAASEGKSTKNDDKKSDRPSLNPTPSNGEMNKPVDRRGNAPIGTSRTLDRGGSLPQRK